MDSAAGCEDGPRFYPPAFGKRLRAQLQLFGRQSYDQLVNGIAAVNVVCAAEELDGIPEDLTAAKRFPAAGTLFSTVFRLLSVCKEFLWKKFL